MECDVSSFETDPEGLSIAADINSHLPEQVLPCEPASFSYCYVRLHTWVAKLMH